jgi:hypothetical protein
VITHVHTPTCAHTHTHTHAVICLYGTLQSTLLHRAGICFLGRRVFVFQTVGFRETYGPNCRVWWSKKSPKLPIPPPPPSPSTVPPYAPAFQSVLNCCQVVGSIRRMVGGGGEGRVRTSVEARYQFSQTTSSKQSWQQRPCDRDPGPRSAMAVLLRLLPLLLLLLFPLLLPLLPLLLRCRRHCCRCC